MKKIYLFLVAICLSLSILPIQSKAAFVLPETTNIVDNAKEPTEINGMQLKLNAVNAIDNANITFTERKSLKTEIRSMKQSLSEMGGGIYLSVGAIILIIILLIILL